MGKKDRIMAGIQAANQALAAQNRRLRLQLLLLATDPTHCAHEWRVTGTRLLTGGGMDRVDYVDLVCQRCYATESRRVTAAWIRAYEDLRAEGAA